MLTKKTLELARNGGQKQKYAQKLLKGVKVFSLKWSKLLVGFLLLVMAQNSIVSAESKRLCFEEQRDSAGKPCSVRWPIEEKPVITFKFDDSVPEDWRTPILLAAASWNIALIDAGINLKFSLKPDPNSPNVIKVIHDPSGKYPANSPVVANKLNGVCMIQSVSMIFNTAVAQFTTKDEPDKYDVQGVATHEFGHWLGLGDIEGILNRLRCKDRSVMVELIIIRKTDTNEVTRGLRNIKPDDIEALKIMYPSRPPISKAIETATVLVMDVSGSMASQWHGGIKIESAKKAALQYIEQVANEPRPVGVTHYIGVVTFSDSASVVCPLTTSYDAAKKTVISLGTIAWTNLGAGLDTALQELSKLPAGAKKFIILLSDGMTNRGKSRESILQTSVAEARRQGICIHTVGFGDPGDIDEDFLKKIATQSGCGSYNYASSGFELFTTYVKVRHATLGSNRFVEYRTTTPAYFFPGESITLGAFQLTAPAQELHYTVAWSGPVVLQAKLVDPQGRVVDNRYPNSVIYSGSGFSHVTVFSPIPGIWRAAATVKSAAMQPAEYYGVASARTGGYVIPYIPPPCLVKADNTCVIPMPDLPTAVVVAIGVAVWIWWFYNQIFK
jgi:Mg-chelatase subunit ChlD